MTRTVSAAPFRRSLALSTALGMSLGVLAMPARAQNTPQSPTIQGGTVTIADNRGGSVTNVGGTVVTLGGGVNDNRSTLVNVNVGSSRAVVDWQSFDIKSGSTVTFANNTTGNAAILNRVAAGNPSDIAGTMSGPNNLAVWLINPSGIVFNSNQAINLGSFVASTLNVDKADFMAGGDIRLLGATGSTASISSTGNTPASINTTGGVLALIAPKLDLNVATDSDRFPTAFVTATDVSVNTGIGSPLSITVAKGTAVEGQTIKGAVVGDRIYVLLTPQDAVDATLNMTAKVTNATTTPEGVVVLGTNIQRNAGDAKLDTGAFTTGSTTINLGDINLRDTVANGTPTNGPSVEVLARASATTGRGGGISVGNVTAGGGVGFSTAATNTPTVGTVSLTGNIDARTIDVAGANVVLGRAGATVLQQAREVVRINAVAGQITSAGALTLNSDNGGAGAIMQLAAKNGYDLSSATLVAGTRNGTASSRIDFVSDGGTALALGAVRAGTLQQNGSDGLRRTAGASLGAITLTGNNDLGSTGTLQVGRVITGGNLTLRGGAGLSVTDRISNLANTGDVTLIASSGRPSVAFADSDLAGALTVNGGAGGVSFGNLTGAGARTITSGGDIEGRSIAGTGAVSLTSVAGAKIAITGAVGTPTAQLGSLTVDGGKATLGSVNTAGAATFGRTTALDSLTVANTVDAAGLFARASGPVQFGGAVRTGTGAVDVASTGDSLTFSSTLSGQGALTVGAGGSAGVVFNGTVGAGAGFASLTATNGTPVTLNTDIVRTAGAQRYGGVLKLNTAATLTGTDANFNGIDGANGGANHDLTLNFSGITALAGVNVAGVRNLVTDAAGSTTLSGTVTTSGTQRFADAVALTGSTTLVSTGTDAAGDIMIAGALSGPQALVVNTAGTARLTGGAIGLSSIATVGAGNTSLAGVYETTGGQSFAHAVQLAGDTTVRSTQNMALGFGGAVSGRYALTVATNGVTTLTGAVGGTLANGTPDPATALTSLTSTGTGVVSVKGGAVTTTGAQTYTGPLQLGGATVLTGATGALKGGVIGGDNDLTLNFSGPTLIDGAAFGGVRNLATGGGGTTNLSGTIATSGGQSYGNDVVLGGDTLIQVGGGTGTAAVAFGGAVDGLHLLKVASGGTTTFGKDVGVGQKLTSLEVTGATILGGTGTRQVVTDGAQTYGAGLQLAANTVLAGTGATLTGGVNGSTNGVDHDLALNFSGLMELAGGAFVGVRNLSTDAAGTTKLAGNFTTSGTQRFNDPVTLTGATVLRSIGGGPGGDIGFGQTLSGPQALSVITGGTASFAAGATGLQSITTTGAGLTVLNATLSTTDGQSFGNVVLGSDTLVQTGTNGPLSFGGTVTGAHALAIDMAALTTFSGPVGVVGQNGKVGAGTPLSLTTTGGGIVLVAGGQIITSGAQSYSGPVQLGVNTELSGTTGTFVQGIDGKNNDLSLTFTAPITLAGLGVTNVRNLSVGGGVGTRPGGPNTNSPGTTTGTISLAGTVSSTGGQTYNGNILLTGDTVLKSGDGTGTGDISFSGSVSGTQALTVTTAGLTSFTGAVGGTPLTAVTIDGTGNIAFNGASVATSGAQSYRGAVMLGGDTSLSTNGANIAFGSTIDGPYQLSLQTGANTVTGGAISFAGALGGNTALTGLGIRADSVTVPTGSRVGTVAAQVNTGGFALANDAALVVGSVGTVSGIKAATGAVVLSAAGPLALNAGVTGTGVSLTGTGVTQAAGGLVDAGTGAIAIDGNDGAILLGGSLLTTSDGANAVRVFDGSSLGLGAVTTGADGSITLGLGGADGITGAVTQTAGVLTAGLLTGNAGGSVSLTAANRIGTLGGFSANGFALTTAGALSVSGTTDAGTGNLTLASGGPLALGAHLLARTGTVALNAGGAITQGAGAIAASVLTGRSTAGDISLLSAGNTVVTLGAFGSTGALALRDSVALAVTGDLSAAGALTLTAPGLNASGRTLSAGGPLSLDGQGGDVAAAALTGVGVDVTGAGVIVGTADAGTGSLSFTTTDATRALTLGAGVAGTFATLTGAGAVTVQSSLTANGAVTVLAGGAARLGDLTSRNGAVSATGSALRVANATAGGSLLLRSTAGALALNSGSAGGTATLESGGTLDLTNALGSAGDAALTAAGATTVKAVSSSAGSVLVKGLTTAVDSASAKTALIVQASGGDLLLQSGAAGGDASLTASGGVKFGNVGSVSAPIGGKLSIAAAGGGITGGVAAASGAVSLSASGPIQLDTLNGGGIVAVGRSVAVGSADSTGALTMQANNGTLVLGTGTAAGTADLSAKGDLTIQNKLTSGRTATISTGGDAQLASVLAESGDVVVRATGQIGGLNGGRADLSAPGGTVKLAAGTVVSLGPITADSFSLEAPTIDLVSVTANTLLLNATAGTLTLGSGTVTGTATLTAKTALSLGRLTAGGPAIVTAGTTATVGSVNASEVSISGVTTSVDSATTTGGALLVRATGGDLSLRTATAAGAATLDAAGALSVTDVLTTAGDLGLTGTGAVTTRALTSTGGAVSVQGNVVNIAGAIAKTGLGVTALTGDALLGDSSAGGAATVKAAGTVALNTLTSGGTASVMAGGDLTGTSIVAGAGATATATNALKLATLSGAGVTGAGKTVEIGTVASTGELALNATGGSLLLDKAGVTGGATLAATGPVTITTSLATGGNAAVTSGGTVTVASIASSGGDLGVMGKSVAATGAAANGALALTATDGALALGTGTAGAAATLKASGPVAITTSLTSGGTASVASGDAVAIAAITSSAGDATVSGTAVSAASATAGRALTLTASNGALSLGTGTAGAAAMLKASGPVAVTTSLTSGGAATVSSGDVATVAAISSNDDDVTVSGTAVSTTGATAGKALTMTASNGALSLGTGRAGGVAALTASGPVTVVASLAGDRGAFVSSGAGAQVASIASMGGDVRVAGKTADVADAVAGAGLVLDASAGALTLGRGTAAGAATLTASGPVTVATSLVSGGAASVTSGDVARIVSIASTNGDLRVGGKTTDVANAAAGAGLFLDASAGALTMGKGTAAGAATLTSSGPVTVSTSLTSGGAASVTSGGLASIANIASTGSDVGVTGATLAVTGASANRALSLKSNGALSLGTGTAGTTATVTAGGPLAITTSLAGGGAVQTSSTGATTAGAVSSTGGALGMTATGLSVANAKAATTLDLAATAGDLTLGTGNAGGAATLRATGAVASTGLTTGGAATLTAGTTLNSGAVNATGAAALTATGAATLGATTAGGAVTVAAASIGAGQTNAGTTLTMTSPGNISVAGGQAGGDAGFDSGGTVALGQFTGATAGAVNVKALDADITGTLRAGTVTFTNRAPTTTATKLGNNTSAGGFTLSAAEVNNVEAGQLTLDAGAGNVELGGLAFDADAGRTRVDLLSTGRIDVNGTVTGSGAGRTFRIGGTAGNTTNGATGGANPTGTAIPTDKASVIRVTATSEAGGRLLFDTADLDLRGSRIAVGQAPGFLDAIGVGSPTGQSAAEVATAFVGNPNSALYNPAFGGVSYPGLSALVTARSLTVRYNDYALFQNTSAPGQNSGVTLGTLLGGPTSGSLTVQGPGANTVNAFALFGSIGGITGTAASVLGPPIVNVTGTDPANTRINGCAAGSGAGCLTAVVTQPLLTIFDTTRVVVVRASDDLALPFDPVVGTSNEALFTGLGLLDDAVTPTACAADAVGPGCAQTEEKGK